METQGSLVMADTDKDGSREGSKTDIREVEEILVERYMYRD